MKNTTLLILGIAASFYLGFFFKTISLKETKTKIDVKKEMKYNKKIKDMKLGNFSVSLSVKDIKVSKQFYESLGFKAFFGNIDQKFIIMKNGSAIIGLFQGMFENNILTFNPGWDENGQNIDNFDDVRDIQRQLKSENIKLITEADEKTTGPASFMVADPDGNVILFDQHR